MKSVVTIEDADRGLTLELEVEFEHKHSEGYRTTYG